MIRHLFDVYRSEFVISLNNRLQYRVELFMQLAKIMIEPVVYLVVWQVTARSNGGQVAGYTADDFALYFIMWSVVRQMTVAWDPSFFEWRVRRGDFNPLLMRPIHPIHVDTANLVGWKVVEMIVMVPTLVVLWLVFKPSWQAIPWALAAFVPALVMGFVLRYVLMYALAMSAFWLTKLEAIFRAWFLVEFFLSGRIAPLGVLPPLLQTIASYLPFEWMFAFPLELVLGNLTQQETLTGFAIQAVWILASVIALRVLWKSGIRRYSAVGG